MNSKQRGKRRLISIVMFVVTAAIVLALVLSNRQPSNLPDQIVWLTPSEFAKIKRIGPLTRVKYQLMRWTAPLWNSYWRNKPQFTVSANVVTLPTEMSWSTSSFSPFATTTNGTRCWILSPEQVKSIQAELGALPETAVALRSQVIVSGGLSAQVSSGNTVGSGSNTVFFGSAVFLIPDVANDKVLLTFELNHSQLETDLKVKTNQAYACRAVFPNNGGLIVENPNPELGASNRPWLFLSAKAVDANGRLIGR
jgi:hypothetical protein